MSEETARPPEEAEAPPDGAMTIGAVCELLKADFPSISISKIRYLEDQKLITPRRTPGGYRLYTPLEVERQLTFPIEHALSGLPGLAEVRSMSKFGFSQTVLTFSEGTELWLARQVVSERLNGIEWSPGLERPTLGPISTGLGEVFHYLVKSRSRPLSEVPGNYAGCPLGDLLLPRQ